MIIFFTIFFSLYSVVNYYVFERGWQALISVPFLKPFYIFIFLLFSLSYIFTKIFAEKIPAYIYDPLLWIGSFWFAFLLYFILILFLIDFVRISNFFFHFLPGWLNNPSPNTKLYIGSIVFSTVLLIVIAGFINRSNIVLKTILLELPKKSSTIDSLNVVILSDIHLSAINNEAFLEKIVRKVNSQNPDIILMPGDIVDDKSEILRRDNIGNSLRNFSSKYGTFVCTGNHEYINHADSVVSYMREFNINVLRDSYIKINNQFYVIGREDISINSFAGRRRKVLKDIITEAEENLPKILLDHTPVQLNDAVENGIDLQLSGHTHNGQMFPLNLITKMIYEVSWGYLKKDATQFYVSSGVGTWGPPVKLASDPEIVNIKIKFY